MTSPHKPHHGDAEAPKKTLEHADAEHATADTIRKESDSAHKKIDALVPGLSDTTNSPRNELAPVEPERAETGNESSKERIRYSGGGAESHPPAQHAAQERTAHNEAQPQEEKISDMWRAFRPWTVMAGSGIIGTLAASGSLRAITAGPLENSILQAVGQGVLQPIWSALGNVTGYVNQLTGWSYASLFATPALLFGLGRLRQYIISTYKGVPRQKVDFGRTFTDGLRVFGDPFRLLGKPFRDTLFAFADTDAGKRTTIGLTGLAVFAAFAGGALAPFLGAAAAPLLARRAYKWFTSKAKHHHGDDHAHGDEHH